MTSKTYLVGGAVRDLQLGETTPKDRDYVVVGSSESDMLQQGFTRVGQSFPVFLHPETGDEYALARTERKVGHGYSGFQVDVNKVSIEDDLRRRDLTINSMAIDPDTGELIDPFNGLEDLRAGVLRHTSEAFAEDPVRVLRLARFAARYNFIVNDSTVQLAKQIVGELANVPAERIWKELERGLIEPWPQNMVVVLRQVGAMEVGAVRSYFIPATVNELSHQSEDQYLDNMIDKLARVRGETAYSVALGGALSQLSQNGKVDCYLPSRVQSILSWKLHVQKVYDLITSNPIDLMPDDKIDLVIRSAEQLNNLLSNENSESGIALKAAITGSSVSNQPQQVVDDFLVTLQALRIALEPRSLQLKSVLSLLGPDCRQSIPQVVAAVKRVMVRGVFASSLAKAMMTS